jgi:hypothetical protein
VFRAMARSPGALRGVGRILEHDNDRRSFAITVLTAGNEHVRKLRVASAISTISGR